MQIGKDRMKNRIASVKVNIQVALRHAACVDFWRLAGDKSGKQSLELNSRAARKPDDLTFIVTIAY